ncbi:MAG: nucleotide exchange factor GrpE [Gammaproteobacteria bacterium]|nr:nucleotide exchange factor GrpE [Gammaproteobacteria bacterium]
MNVHDNSPNDVIPPEDVTTGEDEVSEAGVNEIQGNEAQDETGAQTAVKEAGQEDAPANDDVSAEEASTESLTALVAELQAAVAAKDDAVLRMKAELDNTRKRVTRDVEKAHKYALERFVNELLPVKDSLELGITACDNESADLASVREGIELTDKMFAAAVEKFGVAVVDPEGETFNPQFHQAVSMQAAEDGSTGQVIAVIQKGYLLNDRLVRPAMVIVSQ